MKLLLITSEERRYFHVGENHLKKIRSVSKDIEVFVVPDTQPEDVLKHALDADIIVGFPAILGEVIGKAKNLKWAHSFSAGVDKLLTPEIVASPVLVSNSSGVHAIPIAEHIIAFMLLFTKRFYDTFRFQQNKKWQRRDDLEELYGKTILIVGLGHIGTQAAKLAHCFGMHVIATNRELEDKPEFVEEIKSPDQIDEMLPRADFVVLSVPHTKETHHMFNTEKLQKMKPSAVLINIGRGGVVNENDLIAALEQKTIRGAALDVTEIEPLPSDSPLWGMENVILTPHHSGTSSEYMNRAIERFCLNLQAFLKNKSLPNLVDKERGY